MRLERYINDTEYNNIIVKELNKNCSEYINIAKKGTEILYRGTRRTILNYEKFVPRTDRKPTDTPRKTHKILDELFYKNFGWKPRSEGVFATSTWHVADSVGTAYWFFPVNGFKFIWSACISDLYIFLKNETDAYFVNHGEAYDIIKNDVIPAYTDENLFDAMESKNEIMFKCKAYYLVDNDVVMEQIFGRKFIK